MSDARVTFETLDYEPATPGQEQRFDFACPRHKGRRCAGLIIAGSTELKRNRGIPQWNWDGNRERPTFTPSINCKGCWHGYIRDGRCVDTSGREEPEPA